MPARSKSIKAYNKDLNLTLYFRKAKEAAAYLGCDASVIAKICKGKLESSWGWEFNYIEYSSNINFVSELELKTPLKYNKHKKVWNKGKSGIYSKESLSKMREAKLGKKASENTRLKQSMARKSYYANKDNFNIKIKKKCEECKREYVLNRKAQKYCSNKCRQTATIKIMNSKDNSYDYNRRSQSLKRMWNERKAEILKKRNTEEYKRKIGKSTYERFEDPKFREKHKKAVQAAMTEEYKKALSRAAIKRLKKGQRVTKPHSIILDLLKAMRILYVAEKSVESEKYGLKSYDIFLPEYNVFIEIMGDYHHCNPEFYKTPSEYQNSNMKNDAIKKKMIEELPNYKLIYIWASDIYFSMEKCKYMILQAICGKNENNYPQITFDQFSVRSVEDRDIIKKFLWKYHYIPCVNLIFKKAYGLYVGNSLMGICVFGSPTAIGALNVLGKGLELTRFTLADGLPKNSASWFMSKCLKALKSDIPDLDGVISYSDKEKHIGTLYKASNWQSLGETKGSYYYINPEGEVLSRHKVWNFCKKMGVLERDLAEIKCLKKVKGSVKEKFIFKFT